MVNESSSEDESIIEALREAADREFLNDSLFKREKSETNSNKSASSSSSDRPEPSLKTTNDFYNFGVSQNYRNFVAKKLHEHLERNIVIEEDIRTKKRKKKRKNMDIGIKLFSSSTNVLTCVHDEELPNNILLRKKISTTDNSKAIKLKCKQVAVDGALILSKEETKAWNERPKGTVFKYKKMPNGILVEQQ